MSENTDRAAKIGRALVAVGVDKEVADRTAINLAEQQADRDLVRDLFGDNDKPSGSNPFSARRR